jgi:hypothetical protein
MTLSGGQILKCGTISCFIALHLLQGVTVQCLEYFIFVMEGTGKKWQRVVLRIKAKIDTCNRLERGKNRNKLMKEYG